jgi:predicted dehydrogenase
MGIGIVGCGNISRAYFKGAEQAKNLRIVGCADLRREAAEERAREFACRALGVEELLRDPEVELVVNLTIPRAHAAVAVAALEAGKHVYCEKPLATTTAEADRMMVISRASRLRVGCAPDTFLGAGLQTCRKIYDEGAIGEAVAAFACMACAGHESWHPSPAFYYDIGGGPMLDMGPYYLTALVNLLGPARRVAASSKASFKERIATSAALTGTKIPVHCTTHVTGVVDFWSGATATIVMSFDIQRHTLPRFEMYGTEGSMQLPDPNGFSGTARLSRKGQADWQDAPVAHADNARMFGVVDMVSAIRSGRPHRVSGELAYHVLEIMQAFDRSSSDGRHIEITSRCERPAPVPSGLAAWRVD